LILRWSLRNAGQCRSLNLAKTLFTPNVIPVGMIRVSTMLEEFERFERYFVRFGHLPFLTVYRALGFSTSSTQSLDSKLIERNPKRTTLHNGGQALPILRSSEGLAGGGTDVSTLGTAARRKFKPEQIGLLARSRTLVRVPVMQALTEIAQRAQIS
jgi:hypothetical protein